MGQKIHLKSINSETYIKKENCLTLSVYCFGKWDDLSLQTHCLKHLSRPTFSKKCSVCGTARAVDVWSEFVAFLGCADVDALEFEDDPHALRAIFEGRGDKGGVGRVRFEGFFELADGTPVARRLDHLGDLGEAVVKHISH